MKHVCTYQADLGPFEYSGSMEELVGLVDHTEHGVSFRSVFKGKVFHHFIPYTNLLYINVREVKE